MESTRSEAETLIRLDLARTLISCANIHLQLASITSFMESVVEATRIFQELEISLSEICISGFDLYELSLLHPECAATA